MATFVFHPILGKVVKANRKGMNKDKTKQYWVCLDDTKKFTTDAGAENHVDQTTGKILGGSKKTQNATKATAKTKAAPKKEAPTKANAAPKNEESGESTDNNPSRITTIVKINNNEVARFPKEMTVDEAFKMISATFMSASATQSHVTKQPNGDVVIQFTIKTGTKG